MKMKRFFSILMLALLSLFSLQAQIYNPVKWSTEVKALEQGEYELLVHATIDKGWHLYSQYLPSDDGPIATEFTFPAGDAYELLGKVKEPKAKTEYDPNFDMDLNYFEEKVTFSQRIRNYSQKQVNITAEVYFMVCDAEKCLPPEYVDLEFMIPAGSSNAAEGGSMGDAGANEERSEEPGKTAQEEKTAVSTSTSTEALEDEPQVDLGSIPGGGGGVLEPVKWKYFSEKAEEGVYKLHFKATIDEGWHLYSQFLESDEGPIATAFYFGDEVERLGKVEEVGERLTQYDKVFEMPLSWFEGEVDFVQQIKADGGKVRVEFEFMACNDRMCTTPAITEIEFDLETGMAVNVLDLEEDLVKVEESIIPYLPNVDLEEPLGDCGDQTETSNLWMVFIFGFLGGLIALLTPCVFPMIPLTVSFFTKGDGDESKGIGKAVLYGFFIFLIYAVLSIPFHFNTDPEVLNEVATSVWLNIIFFVVFVVFAISFFGYFEITLPSSLTNKADSASQVGGVLGIFFMALTLALVSFSCTGPILGTVLGNALKNGPWPITAAMSGFGIALGLPFAIFAAFPSFMNKLPKSGGWLNSVKVVLGFIELALAVKFLSNADLVEQWGFLKRETFFLIWTLIGIGLSLYLLGIISFPHDSPRRSFTPFKVAFTTLVIAFTVYIAPGVLKNPPWNHNLLSGFPPPTFYGWYEKETFHAEFTDFDEAMVLAAELGKPVLIDFTGWACVNCRKMEESVWTVESIKEKLREDFVLVSLYVDDKVKLPEEQQGVFEYEVGGEVKKKKIKTIGNKWATFQTQVFNNNSQPYYVMLSPDGYLLGNPVGYTPDVEEYADFLDCGIRAFRSHTSPIAKN